MAAALGIHASEVKVVNVYEGSLIINYYIINTDDDNAALQKVQESQIEAISTGKLNFGAPILDANVAGDDLVEDGVVITPGYDPIILTKTTSNKGSSSRSGGSGGSISSGGRSSSSSD